MDGQCGGIEAHSGVNEADNAVKKAFSKKLNFPLDQLSRCSINKIRYCVDNIYYLIVIITHKVSNRKHFKNYVQIYVDVYDSLRLRLVSNQFTWGNYSCLNSTCLVFWCLISVFCSLFTLRHKCFPLSVTNEKTIFFSRKTLWFLLCRVISSRTSG
jgi:hypothetical protein